MDKKLTYQELAKRVQLLEAEVVRHKQTEQALREKLKRFRELWDDAPIAYHVLDTGGIIKEVNHTELDML